jgi:predicted nucleotidyltransferase
VSEQGLRFEDRFYEQEVALLEVFNKYGVRFILIGGVAVAFHGARSIEDTTNDIDFILSPTLLNGKKIFDAVSEIELNAGIAVDPQHAENFAKPKKQYRIFWMHCALLTASSEVEFDRYFLSSILTQIKSQRVRVLSIEHLIEMKAPIANSSDEQAAKHAKDCDMLKQLTLNP